MEGKLIKVFAIIAFLLMVISIGSMNNHTRLVWDDLSIQLHGEGEPIADGIFYCLMKLEVLQG